MFSRIYRNKCYFIGLLFFSLIFLYTPGLFACANSVTLSWAAPSANADGSPLNDMNGYKIYYGNISGSYPFVINAGMDTAYEVCSLTEGLTYYFAVTAYDTSGNESAYSHEVSKTVVSSNIPPVAAAGGIYSDYEGHGIILDGSGSGDADGNIVLYEWDVNNDGIYDYSSSSAAGSHIYDRQGVYIIKLRVTDDLGATGKAVTTAYVSDTSPAASFTGHATGGTAPLKVNFSNASSGHDSPFTYEWDFDGNGTVDSTAGDPSYTYTHQGTYTVKLTVRDSDGSINTFTRTNYITVNHSYALDCTDGGGIECLERIDGGSDSDNLVDGKPMADVEYGFRINIKDTSGRTPQYVKLFMTQRQYPLDEDFYSFRMSCDGNIISGGSCSYVTQLGPAAVHKFYFQVQFFDGTIRRHPEAGYITGPVVQLLRGFNLAGMPRNTGNNYLDGYDAFGSTSSYRWNGGGYTQIMDSGPVRQGEGYYILKQTATLPELAEYGEIQDAEYAYELKPGWNIISNPYSGNVELSEIKIRKGSNPAAGWMESTSSAWVANAIYYRNGIDWGDNFIPIRPPQAKLVPWRGYWIYLYMTDDIYYLVIPKPQK